MFQTEMKNLSNHCTEVVDEFLKQISFRANQGIVETSQAWNDAATAMKSDGEKHIKAIYGDLNALLQSTEQIWSSMSSLSQSIGESVAGMRGKCRVFANHGQGFSHRGRGDEKPV